MCKLITIQKVLHSRDDVDILYLKEKTGEEDFSVMQLVDAKFHGLEWKSQNKMQ